jgi:hypothetical protein
MSASNAAVNDLLTFCDESMKWCAKESEASATRIGDVFQTLMNEAKRVFKMSEHTLETLQSYKEQLSQMGEDGAMKSNELIRGLKKLAKQNSEIDDIASPIIESLQFQDRIRQNMENVVKILKHWTEHRHDANVDMVAFGNELLTKTTMPEERDIIRRHISGLNEEAPAAAGADDGLFF